MNEDTPPPPPEPDEWDEPLGEVDDAILDAYERERRELERAEEKKAGSATPPHNLDAERSMLGAMLMSGKARDQAATLNPDAYYRPAHAAIHEAILALHDDGQGVDTVTVAAQLGRDVLDTIGGPGELDGLVVDTPSTKNVGSYLQIVAQCHRRRTQVRTAYDLIEAAMAGTPTDEAVGMLEELEGQSTTNNAVRLGDTLPAYVDLLEARADGTAPSGLSTGLDRLDAATGGFRAGQLVTVCARPGCGKSDMACQAAFNAAGAGTPTLFVSIEMGVEELQDRWMAEASAVRHGRLRKGHIAERDWAHITTGLGRLADIPLYVHDDPGANLASIRYQARRIPDIGLVIVDYLQLMDSVGRHENRQTEVASLSRGLKRLARDLGAPVVALAQLNRGVEARMDKRPQLADLRESGAIEQDSDIVIGLYREDLYDPDKSPGSLEAILLKHRTGALGPVHLIYDPTTSTIRSPQEEAA